MKKVEKSLVAKVYLKDNIQVPIFFLTDEFLNFSLSVQEEVKNLW